MLQIARNGGYSQRELGERLCVTHSVVSRLLQALEALGLVTREPHPKDRRIKLTSVTDDGFRALRECFADARSRGAQATGEGIWLNHWRAKIARNGLRVDSILRARPPRDFLALAQWSRSYVPSAADVPVRAAPEAPDRSLELAIRALGIDWNAWLRGEWVPTQS